MLKIGPLYFSPNRKFGKIESLVAIKQCRFQVTSHYKLSHLNLHCLLKPLNACGSKRGLKSFQKTESILRQTALENIVAEGEISHNEIEKAYPFSKMISILFNK